MDQAAENVIVLLSLEPASSPLRKVIVVVPQLPEAVPVMFELNIDIVVAANFLPVVVPPKVINCAAAMVQPVNVEPFILNFQPDLIFALFILGPATTVINSVAVSNAFSPDVAPVFIILYCPVVILHWCVDTVVTVHEMPFIVSVPSVPSVAVDGVTVVVAPAVPAARTVRPPAGTSSAAPTHRARNSNRGFMVVSLRWSPKGPAARTKSGRQDHYGPLRLPFPLAHTVAPVTSIGQVLTK